MFLILFFILASLSYAQTDTHAATLTWQDSRNPTGTTYNVYRADGLCSGTPSWSKIASAVTAKTYEDTTVQPGNYCYTVTAVLNGMESAQSNWALAPVPSFPPQQLGVTVK